MGKTTGKPTSPGQQDSPSALNDGVDCACGNRQPHMRLERSGIMYCVWWVGCELHGMFNCGGGVVDEALAEYRRILQLAKKLAQSN
ncbi:MAG TPA: hypothetical protein VJ327_00885 [Patescibacteria group bacterium]|nr:hypothetical protein [Patescibacteria group bacterium]